MQRYTIHDVLVKIMIHRTSLNKSKRIYSQLGVFFTSLSERREGGVGGGNTIGRIRSGCHPQSLLTLILFDYNAIHGRPTAMNHAM